MTATKKNTLHDKLNRLKKALQKVWRSGESQTTPQLVLQPAPKKTPPKGFFGNMMVTRNGYIRMHKLN